MKKKLFLMFSGLMLLGAQLLADVTITASAIVANAAAVITDPSQVNVTLWSLLGAAFGMPMQSFIEHAIAEKPWMNTWAKSFKPLLPVVLPLAAGFLVSRFGVSPTAALSFVGTLTTTTHLVNASDALAADATPKAAQ